MSNKKFFSPFTCYLSFVDYVVVLLSLSYKCVVYVCRMNQMCISCCKFTHYNCNRVGKLFAFKYFSEYLLSANYFFGLMEHLCNKKPVSAQKPHWLFATTDGILCQIVCRRRTVWLDQYHLWFGLVYLAGSGR